ncbi:MAG: hypothetical protein QXY07_00280 [Candidatus Bathyarchaeia archaeon]
MANREWCFGKRDKVITKYPGLCKGCLYKSMCTWLSVGEPALQDIWEI